MDVLSVRDYRNNLASSFDRAAAGEKVLIRRKNSLYALISIDNDDVCLSREQQRRIDEMAQSIQRSWNQVKEIEAGRMSAKSAKSFLDEL